MVNHNLRRAVRLALTTGAATSAMCASVAVAQEEQATDEGVVGTVVVTGTRIVRKDYTAASPIISVSAADLKSTGTVTVEQLLNTLPQIVPDISSTSNNPPGEGKANINIRGLGANRNLVLINGRRMTPSDEDGVVDVNTIPTPLIERVEVITGGASAVYGADAVAGVVNFVLKRDFSGAQISTEYGMTEQGDGDVINGDFVLGGNFEDNKGNATVYGSYTKREAVNKVARAFSSQATDLTSYFPTGSYVPGANLPSQATLDALFTGYGATGPVLNGDTFSFNSDGTLFATSASAATSVQNFRDPVDINTASAFFPGRYSFNFEPLNKLVLPLERTSLGGMARYDIGGNAEAYAHVFFTNYNAESSLAPSPAPTGSNTTNPAAGPFFTLPVTNPFIPADLANVLASRTGDSPALPGTGAAEDFLMRTRFLSLGPRVESYDNDIYQGMLGFRGTLPNSWGWDVYYATGRYNNQTTQFGNARVSAVEALLDAPDGGASLCAGGLNLFGFNAVSPECQAFIGVTAKNTTRLEQQIAEATITGDLFNMPAGSAGFAFGVFYQKQDFAFLTDSVLASGDVSGFNAQDAVIGGTSNKDAFVELLLPLLVDKPAITKLDLTLGYRFSDHSTAGSNSSYKAEVDWGIVNSLRFRGTFQRAVRAPGIGELFSPLQEDNPEVADPCNVDSTVRTGPDATAARALCLAQGVPASIIDIYQQGTDQIDALAGGNPFLHEESADTYTAGLVFQPNISNSIASRFSASIDMYNIKIEDAINSITPDVIAGRCYNQDGANPNFELNNDYCNLYGRDAVGQIQDLLENQQNLSVIKVSGVDLQVDWGLPVSESFGQFGFNFVVSYLNKFEVQIAPGDAFKDYAGTIGDDIGDFLPTWKGTLTTNWKMGAFDASLRMRYVDKAGNEAHVDDPSCDTATDCTGVPDTWYMDLSTGWQVNKGLSLRLGVDNLTDQKVRAYSPNVQATTDPSVYDVLGRKYFLLAAYNFGK